jgi:hypothetical protein
MVDLVPVGVTMTVVPAAAVSTRMEEESFTISEEESIIMDLVLVFTGELL